MLWITSRSNLHILRSITAREELSLHLRGNMHLCPGILIFCNCFGNCCFLLWSHYFIIYIAKLQIEYTLCIWFGIAKSTDLLLSCRPCVLYSDNKIHNTSDVADDLSKCSIKEVEKQPVDRSNVIPMSRLPLPAPQNIQGVMIEFYMHFIPSLFPLLPIYWTQT